MVRSCRMLRSQRLGLAFPGGMPGPFSAQESLANIGKEVAIPRRPL